MDRVVGVQDRISEVRARLQSLHRSVEGTAAPNERPQTLTDQPVNLPSAQANRKPAAAPATAIHAGPQQILVQFSPEAERIAQHQSRKIDEQNRQIAFLQSQMNELRARQAPQSPYGRFVPGSDIQPSTVRQNEVQLQLSPGVSTNRRIAEHDASTMGAPAGTPSSRARNFSEMQAMLRAKINGQLSNATPSSPQRLQTEFDQENSPSMRATTWATPLGTSAPIANAVVASNVAQRVGMTSHTDPAGVSTLSTRHEAPQRPSVEESTHANRLNTPGSTYHDVGNRPSSNSREDRSDPVPTTDSRRSGSRKADEGVNVQPNDRSASLSSRHPSVTQEELYGITPLHGRSPNAQLVKLSGAEVFAVLRLRGIVSSQGVTGEHLLPPTTCHMMYLSQGEYAQLTQLRELLAATAAATSTADASVSPASARRQARSPSTRSSALAAFEKHRKRMSSVRESKAHSPAPSKH